MVLIKRDSGITHPRHRCDEARGPRDASKRRIGST